MSAPFSASQRVCSFGRGGEGRPPALLVSEGWQWQLVGREWDWGAGFNPGSFSSPPDTSLCSWTEQFLICIIKDFTIAILSYWAETGCNFYCTIMCFKLEVCTTEDLNVNDLTNIYFILNLSGWHWLVKLYRLQVYNSVVHHLYIVWCAHHPKSSLLPSPPPFTSSPRPPAPTPLSL